MRQGYVYILTTASGTALYIGVTSDLVRRIWEHQQKLYPDCFTAKYHCTKLVYWCAFDSITHAIAEEKKIKAGSRKKKIALINSMNPDWKDLWDEINPDG